MATEILMPALSPTMEEGTLAKWLVKEGDVVKSGQILAEIETDKATMEFEAVDEGTVGKILVAEEHAPSGNLERFATGQLPRGTAEDNSFSRTKGAQDSFLPGIEAECVNSLRPHFPVNVSRKASSLEKCSGQRVSLKFFRRSIWVARCRESGRA